MPSCPTHKERLVTIEAFLGPAKVSHIWGGRERASTWGLNGCAVMVDIDIRALLCMRSPSRDRSRPDRESIEEYVSTQTLVIHQWAGPSVIAHLARDSTLDRA